MGRIIVPSKKPTVVKEGYTYFAEIKMFTTSLKRVMALEKHRGTLWVAAYGEGLFRWEGGKWRQQKGVSAYITSLSSAGNRLWYGTWMQGYIGYLEGSKAVQMPLPRLVVPRFAYRVNCLIASQSEIWVGTQGYLIRGEIESRYDDKEWKHLVSVGSVDSLVLTPRGLWLCADGRVLLVERSPNHFSVASVPAFAGVSVSVLALARDNALWVGANRQGQAFLGKYRTSDGKLGWNKIPSQGDVKAILEVGDYVFVGLGKGGLWRHHQKARRWEHRTTKQVTTVEHLAHFGSSLVIGGEQGVEFGAVS